MKLLKADVLKSDDDEIVTELIEVQSDQACVILETSVINQSDVAIKN